MLLLTAIMLAQATAAEPPAPTPADEKMICRRQPVLGSRIKAKRICKTAEDWKTHDEALKQQTRDIQNAAAPRPD